MDIIDIVLSYSHTQLVPHIMSLESLLDCLCNVQAWVKMEPSDQQRLENQRAKLTEFRNKYVPDVANSADSLQSSTNNISTSTAVSKLGSCCSSLLFCVTKWFVACILTLCLFSVVISYFYSLNPIFPTNEEVVVAYR